jgi:Homeodomain-like domain-containing protein
LPSPKTARYADQPGPAPSERKPCSKCSGSGHFGKRKRKCQHCDGMGTVAIDAYTGQQVAMAGQQVQVCDSRRIDAELARLAKEEAIRRGRLLDDPFAWEAQRLRYRRAGDYAALERALELLRCNEPVHYSAAMRIAYGQPPNGAVTLIEEAIVWLAKRMPPAIRVPSWVTSPPEPARTWQGGRAPSPAREQRNASIAELAAQGVRQAEIASRVGVSVATVSRVLAGTMALAGTVASA